MGRKRYKELEQRFANYIQILTGNQCRRLRVGGRWVGNVENPGSKIQPILEPVQGFEWDPDRTLLQ